MLTSYFQDRRLVTGWICVTISLLLFCVPLLFPENEVAAGFFVFHFIFAIAYFFLPRLISYPENDERKIHYRFITLTLFLISAYALNRNTPVFADSATWYCILLILVMTNFLSSVFFAVIPLWCRYTSYFIFGIGTVLFLYLAIYLVPMYPVSILGLLAFGLSIHTFIPLFFTIATIKLAIQLAERRAYWVAFAGGFLSTITYCIIFITVQSLHTKEINRAVATAMIDGEDQLPLWVQMAQKLDNNEDVGQILKASLQSSPVNWNMGWLDMVPGSGRNFQREKQFHDPLVQMASLFTKPVALPREESINILKSQYNARHQAQERLWSGNDLQTNAVVTNIQVWPEMHLSYTEKTMSVLNKPFANRWPGQQEGIYTFHLPEGGVVTSLSLWINGSEEKGILTTKEKAEVAYKTIVGVERRDPSVVHWQEGNTVSVRVFPVLPNEIRRFKIGVTAPLRIDEGQLAYDNIWFEGPDATDAAEAIRLEMMSSPKSFLHYAALQAENEKVYRATRDYKPIWSLRFDDPGLQPHSFAFNGATYSVLPYEKSRYPTQVTDIFLDINKSWTNKELEAVWEMVKSKRVWIYKDGFQQISEDNCNSYFEDLKSLQFSLFPFYQISDREHSLVISKSGEYSPNLSDLEGSPFFQALQTKMTEAKRVKLFHLGTLFSPYIRSLKEFRLFDFECGETVLLDKLIQDNHFVSDEETNDRVIIHAANLMIMKRQGEWPTTGPDHLMRMFAYNHIMHNYGARGLTKAAESEDIVVEAKEANIVSPVSSLIVLETQEDYDRFDIHKAQNSLKNASTSSNGAVPEPGEWLLIVSLGLILLVFIYKLR